MSFDIVVKLYLVVGAMRMIDAHLLVEILAVHNEEAAVREVLLYVQQLVDDFTVVELALEASFLLLINDETLVVI